MARPIDLEQSVPTTVPRIPLVVPWHEHAHDDMQRRCMEARTKSTFNVQRSTIQPIKPQRGGEWNPRIVCRFTGPAVADPQAPSAAGRQHESKVINKNGDPPPPLMYDATPRSPQTHPHAPRTHAPAPVLLKIIGNIIGGK